MTQLLLAALIFGSGSDDSNRMLPLHKLEDRVADGVMCLDGSPAGFWMSPGIKGHKKDWQIHLAGGGWCTSEIDCYARSFGVFGSSNPWPPQLDSRQAPLGGALSSDCEVNPEFCRFNRVIIGYCDGNSFASDRDEPVVFNDKPLYFRGKRILEAVLETLRDNFGLDKAKQVVLTGGSAGGLAVYHHADRIHDFLRLSAPQLRKYGAIPLAGFFINANNVTGYPVYAEWAKHLYSLSNAAPGLNQRCVGAYSHSDPENVWKCSFAQEALRFVAAPIFTVCSAYDSWQTGCIFTAALPAGYPNEAAPGLECGVGEYSSCQANPEDCTDEQMEVMNGYISQFNSDLESLPTYTKDGNGAFIYSCHSHNTSHDWGRVRNNGVTLQEAVSLWWQSRNEPAAHHTYKPCFYHTDSTPRQCNPSC